MHTSIGGDSARVRFSNEFGSGPLVIGSAYLANRAGGGTVTGSRPVTFGGATSVTVPAGQTAVSDEVAFPVPADGDVAVTVHLPTTAGGTMHGIAVQDTYVASGDQAAAGTLSGAKTESSWYFLSGLDVRNADAAGAVVAFGASITDGFGSRLNGNQRWPDLLADRLRAAGHTVGVLNAGISGNRLTVDDRGESALNRFERDVLSRPGARWVIILDDAINDLGAADPPSAAELIGALGKLVERAHGAGLRVICATLTPYEGAGYWTAHGEAARGEINAFLRGPGSGCDAVLDADRATHDPSAPTRFRPAYDSGDHLHPGAAGLQAIADAVPLDVFTR
ncbi:SGNH/GDSL hydrolase family protein [Actinoplanes hulinensis]|uniref:SGNH/GDSL hydrolase family protein n=1 Tax=Actinoplanes hulinensis TaxID=1144547 RepID=A0ABS7BGB8_9ACTN|nr:SGNH/GDSL hydrolase family protein [Actinoplanes hulinensis]MBW6439947.1 SGNH/GDSL hydrolase family protein [Actinoplanes hulinensis]